MQKITLYKNHKKSIGFWSIESSGDMIIIRHATSLIGIAQTRYEKVLEGKQGRNILEQVRSRIKSRIKKQLDKGYKTTIAEAEADDQPTDAHGNYKPMLALPVKQVSSYSEDSWVQLKYNGHRMLVVNDGGTLRAYSRQGLPIETVDHVLEGIDIPEGTVLDGELYHHGTPLQTIASWAKRKQDNTLKLKYIVYDTISEVPYDQRLRLLNSEDVQLSSNCKLAVSVRLLKVPDLHKLLRQVKSQGFEGLILRQNYFPYEIGRRSRGLIKIKSMEDAEYRVIDIVPSKDNWAVLVCAVGNDIFKVSAPGTIEEKSHVLNHKDKYIGKYVKVEYCELTKAGKPFNPVAIEWLSTL